MAEQEGAWLKIPESVVASDPRWRMLAGKGILKAQWKGIHLKLAPLDEQVLAIETAMASAGECCAKCEYFQVSNSCCICIDSPLSGRRVDPGGYCLEYSADIVGDSNLSNADD